jgi:hypothetical protein
MAGTILSLGPGAVYPLDGRSDQTSATYTLTGDRYDYALAGIPLLSKIDHDQHPYIRTLMEIKRTQFDNLSEPGEQSTSTWWLRSMQTFVGGEGLTYQDPDKHNLWAINYGVRYHSGYGVNPWVDQQLTLLKTTNARVTNTAANQWVQGYTNNGNSYYWSAGGTTVTRDDGTTQTAVTWGGSNTILSFASSGAKYYVADSAGVWSGTDAGNGSKLWTNDISYTRANIAYVKQRLMAAFNSTLYELGADPTSPPQSISGLPSTQKLYTHPNAGWTWTGWAEGTDGIFVAGHDGFTSSIYKIQYNTGTGANLGGAYVNCSMPDGELINDIVTYLGNYVGICTTRGFRVGQIDSSSGNIAYGPLLFQTSGGCQSCTGYDRFFWVTVNSAINNNQYSGLYRVDLGMVLQDQGVQPAQRFAYASDLNSHTTGTVTSVTTFGTSNQRVFSIAGVGTYLEDPAVLEATGYMETGRIRYGMLDPKNFKFASIRTPNLLTGSISITSIDASGAATPLITYSGSIPPGSTDLYIAEPATPQEYISLGFTLARSQTNNTQGPVLNAWQVKAMPGAIRQRQFQLSFLFFDFEKDKTNQKLGYEGRTADRLRTLEQLVQNGNAVQFQDLVRNESMLVWVDQMEFRQSNSGSEIAAEGYGGYLTVQLTTINDNIGTA